MDKSRSDFESFVGAYAPCGSSPKTESGEYFSLWIQHEWELWQASRRQALEEAAQVADRTSNSGRLLLTAGEMNAGEMRTAKAILGYVGCAIRSLEGDGLGQKTL